MAANPKFDALLKRMGETHNRKNEDYASAGNPYSNFEFAAKVVDLFTEPVDQVFAALIAVKLARLGELRGTGRTPNNESIQDTQLDLATYATIWASYYEPTLTVTTGQWSPDNSYDLGGLNYSRNGLVNIAAHSFPKQ